MLTPVCGISSITLFCTFVTFSITWLSSVTVTVNSLEVITAFELFKSIKDNLLTYVPASGYVALIGVSFANVPPTANPLGGPQYPTWVKLYVVPAESVAKSSGVAGPDTKSIFILTFVYGVAFVPARVTVASFCTF